MTRIHFSKTVNELIQGLQEILEREGDLPIYDEEDFEGILVDVLEEETGPRPSQSVPKRVVLS